MSKKPFKTVKKDELERFISEISDFDSEQLSIPLNSVHQSYRDGFKKAIRMIVVAFNLDVQL